MIFFWCQDFTELAIAVLSLFEAEFSVTWTTPVMWVTSVMVFSLTVLKVTLSQHLSKQVPTFITKFILHVFYLCYFPHWEFSNGKLGWLSLHKSQLWQNLTTSHSAHSVFGQRVQAATLPEVLQALETVFALVSAIFGCSGLISAILPPPPPARLWASPTPFSLAVVI